jgi:hypothetical protein
MPRPQLTENVLDRIAAAVDDRTKVDVSHLTTQQRVELLVDELRTETNRAERLDKRIDQLEAKLESNTSDTTTRNPDDTPPDFVSR